jgi:hypothetical protein
MVVIGVKISPPYVPETCTGEDENAVSRIKKVISQLKKS